MRIKTSNRKDKIMKEAAELFHTKSMYAKDFVIILMQINIYGFNNGVLY